MITGASSGIGRQLAVDLAGPGVLLGLIARNNTRLKETADACRAKGAKVETALIDIREFETLAHWLRSFDETAAVDLLIANAGVTSGRTKAGHIESLEDFATVTSINYLGLVATVEPLIGRMIHRKHGSVLMVGSIAGFFGLADAPAYSASKASVLSYGQSIYQRANIHSIKVTVACPGYVTTPMSAQVYGTKPMEMPVELAAAKILKGLRRGKFLITFPGTLALGSRLLTWLPIGAAAWFLKRFGFSVDRSDNVIPSA